MDIRAQAAARAEEGTEEILTETDFYTLKGDDYTIETTLAQIESDYASIFDRKISKRKPLSQEEHVRLCAFVAAMLQRTTKPKETIEGFIDRLVEVVADLEERMGRRQKRRKS
jgi:hypothetical protein